MYRTHHCGQLNSQFVGQEVTLAGWVQTIRKFGAISFVDLRDRYGITQLLLGEADLMTCLFLIQLISVF